MWSEAERVGAALALACLPMRSASRPRRLPPRASAAREGSRWRFARTRESKELGDACIEGMRELLENRYRGVLKAPLQSADVGTIDPRIDREVFLRKPPPNPQPPQVPRHKRLRLHRRRRAA
jgi:hypothetical protein